MLVMQRGPSPPPEPANRSVDHKLELASVAEGHVAWVHVQHEHAEPFEFAEDGLCLTPARAELLLFLRLPIREDLLGKARSLIKIGPGEVEDEGTLDHGHVDDPKLVIEAEQLR